MVSVKRFFALALVAVGLSTIPEASHAGSPVSILPSDDGALYICGDCNTVARGTYLLSAGYIQGDVKFSTSQITEHVSNAELTVTAIGFPVWDPNVEIYGYSSADKLLDVSDVGAGSFLGIMDASTGYGSFDVTRFLNDARSPYVGFRLVTPNNPGADVFGSTGTYDPAHLVFTLSAAPEPGAWALMLLGIGLAGARLRSRARSGTGVEA
jgi:hypothetical protein